MGAASLLAAGQQFLAGQFPATVAINGQSYAVATAGQRRETRYAEGGNVEVIAQSFWFAANAFELAGQPQPKGGEFLIVSENEPALCIDEVIPGATGGPILIRCSSLG